MLEIINLSIKNNDRYLIKDLSLTIHKGDKLAIIGEEGNGKTSLLRAIMREKNHNVVEGTINDKGNKIGYLEQSLSGKNRDKSVFDFLFQDMDDYYEKTKDLYMHMEELCINEKTLEQKMSELSGGEKVKIGILKILLDRSEIILLDEPTNDLDLDTLVWLERFINDTKSPIIFVSHDEKLLSSTANMILHIEQIEDKTSCRHTISRTDYQSYKNNRAESLTKQAQIAHSERREYKKKEEKLKRVMQKVEYRQDTISRQDPFGARILKKKMHTLKAQEKKLENKKLTDIPDVEESINLFFEDVSIPKSKVIATIDIPELKIKGRILARNIKFDVLGNTHLCITGQNGVGKTTLLKEIEKSLKHRRDIKVGYMSQNYDDILKNHEYVLEYISHDQSKEKITEARTRLSSLNFTKEETTGKIKNLSNGSKAKLILAKLVIDKNDVLILDEPTRNLSPLSAPVIRRALKDFKGTIISVSHDRTYIDEVIDEIYLLKPDGIFRKN